MAEVIEYYRNVQILRRYRDYYFYSIDGTVLGSKKGEDLVYFLLGDDSIEEIMYIGERKPLKVFHRKYGMCNTNAYLNDQSALAFISRSAIQNKKTINADTPLLDATLSDGSRLNATIPPASVDGPTFTIRKFRRMMYTFVELIRMGTMSAEIGAFLWTCVEGLKAKPVNMIISGGAGTGKTTFLNACSMFIPYESRVITIEDTIELQLVHEHLIRLESKSGLTMEELLENCLRMRPDRIVVGEVRGKEAETLLTAMNTGHEGSMGTMHANSSRESLTRLTQEPMKVPPMMLSALDLIVMLQRVNSGNKFRRYVSELSEVASAPGENQLPRLNVLFRWDPKKQACTKTGIPSRTKEQISAAAGIKPKQWDDIIKRREMLLAEASKNNYSPTQLMQLIVREG